MTSDHPKEPINPPKKFTDKEAYNLVSDTFTGVNIRGSDNFLQAIYTLASIVLFAIIGAIAAWLNSSWDVPWHGGALIFGFGGMVLGIFTSGLFLMSYRATRHINGKHD